MTFGILLLEEKTGGRVSAIAHKHNYDYEQTSLEILEDWISGRGKQPVTWNTLIEVLYDVELSTLAREIAAAKLPSEDIQDGPTEDSNQSDVSSGDTGDSDQKENGGIPIQNFRHEDSEEEDNIAEYLFIKYFEAMLLEGKASDTDSDDSDTDDSHDSDSHDSDAGSHDSDTVSEDSEPSNLLELLQIKSGV